MKKSYEKVVMRVILRYESFGEYIRRFPVTTAIIAINLLMMLVMEANGSPSSNATLLKYGALFGIPGFEPEWWRYVTAIFLHGGWAHFAFNSFALYVFAPPLERLFGTRRYAIFYVLCGIAGSLASVALHQDVFISIGASGAIYGIYAAYFYIAIFHREWMSDSSRKTIFTIIVIGVLYSILPGIDLWAHLGGFVGGLVLTAIMGAMVKYRRRR